MRGGHLCQLRLRPQRRQHLRAAGQRPVQDRPGPEWTGAGHQPPSGIDAQHTVPGHHPPTVTCTERIKHRTLLLGVKLPIH